MKLVISFFLLIALCFSQQSNSIEANLSAYCNYIGSVPGPHYCNITSAPYYNNTFTYYLLGNRNNYYDIFCILSTPTIGYYTVDPHNIIDINFLDSTLSIIDSGILLNQWYSSTAIVTRTIAIPPFITNLLFTMQAVVYDNSLPSGIALSAAVCCFL